MNINLRSLLVETYAHKEVLKYTITKEIIGSLHLILEIECMEQS